MTRRLLALCLFCFCTPALAQGIVMPIGGALSPDNAAVWSRLVALAGGPGGRIAVLATASGEPRETGEKIAASLARAGARPDVIPIAPLLPGRDAAKDAEDPGHARRIREARGVFLSGGAQERITAVLVRPDGTPTAALSAIRALHARGGVVAGTSAGAAVMSGVMIRDVPDVLGALKSGLSLDKDLAPGLGFLPPGWFVDQHFGQRGRVGRLLPAMRTAGSHVGIGVDEDTAAVVRGASIEVVGTHGVLLVQRRDGARGTGVFAGGEIALTYLHAGDVIDLATGALAPAPGRVEVARARPASTLFSANALGAMDFAKLAMAVAAGDGARGTGLAVDLAANDRPRLGFEFRLEGGSGLRAWRRPGEEAVSFAGMTLSVAPIELPDAPREPLPAPATTRQESPR